MTADKPKTKYIPQFEIENIARIILPKMQTYFESERGKREYEEWKQGQSKGE